MRILIVEDEEKIAQAMKSGLENESYAVDVALTGNSGRAKATTGKYDLVILDRMLPDIDDGLSIVKEMRTEKVQTPVLMLTAKDRLDDRVTGLDTGADDYLVKPFAFEELLARMKALLRRPQHVDGPQMQCADLVLDTVKRTVQRGDDQISLTQKEYAMLEYLLHNQGRIVTKQQMIQHVWDFASDVTENSVEVYMGYLRNKVDRPFPKLPALLHTVRGFGYRLGTL